MRTKTFSGGLHPREIGNGKRTTGPMSITQIAPPDTVVILMSQNIGSACEPLVKKGDRVLMGQKVGEPTGFVGAPVHSSVSGIVTSMETSMSPDGNSSQAVTIQNDFKDEWVTDIKGVSDPLQLSNEEILSRIREAGIVGMGGAGFPTQVKLMPPKDKKIDTIILNGSECEPYLTADHRVMVEDSEAVLQGLLIAMKAVGAQNGYIAIEDNKPDAIAAMQKVCAGKGVHVAPLKTKYPQGGEKLLITSVTKRQVPDGGLPMDVGTVVFNVSTAAAIYHALKTGKPLIERVITVTGEVGKPCNLRVRVGTQVGHVIEECGGLAPTVNKMINGGPMMGNQMYRLDAPVVKGTCGLLFLTDNTPERFVSNCIRCSGCVNVCPIRLVPFELHQLSQRAMFDRAEQQNAMSCFECGACSYTCPARLPLVQSIRVAKREINKRNRLK